MTIPTISCLAALAAAGSALLATAPAVEGPYTLPALAYRTNALNPAIDTATMEIHHGKHHAGYVRKLNAAVEGMDVPENVELLIADLDSVPSEKRTAIRNNGGGHANHSLFWTILAEPGKGGEASPELAAAIEKSFGGMDGLKEALSKAAATRFGSGWAWLVVDHKGNLVVTSTPNQDNPLMGARYVDQPGTPIIGIDVWEHAYYLAYQNRRGDYLGAIWSIMNWPEISRRYAEAKAGAQG
ncbi:MAG: superoxide dismutase [Phycisphaerales bacterium]